MKLLLIPVLVTVLGQAGDDPAGRMKAMEEKIAKAKSFQVTFDGKIDGNKGKGSLQGMLTVGPDNKVRVDANADFMAKKAKLEVISDGSKIVTLIDGNNVSSENAPKNLRVYMTVVAARIGPTGMLVLRTQGLNREVEDPLEVAKLSDLKTLKSEKVGDREAVVIAFKLTIKEPSLTLNGTVWIDSKTNLPLKRILTEVKDGKQLSVTETYSNFRINPKLEAKVFELPK